MNITIKEIAKLADVSRGTVDRVIHGRPGVKPDIRKKVLAILKDFNYQPNLAGKALVQSRRNIKIGVVLSPDFNPFVEEMKKGIADEAEKISAFGVELDIEVIRAFDSSEQLAVLETLCEKDVSAIAIVPVDDESIRIRINEIVEGGIPVVTFNSDLPGSRRLCFVGQDNFRAGRTQGALAHILLREISEPKIAIITSTLHLACHKERVDGFQKKLSECTNFQVVACEENFDMDDVAFTLTSKYLETSPDLSLIYLTGGGIAGVARALERKNTGKFVRVLCHDLIPESRQLLYTDRIDAVIGQDPYNQGCLPIRILFDYLFMAKKPTNECIYTNIEIFTSENTSSLNLV